MGGMILKGLSLYWAPIAIPAAFIAGMIYDRIFALVVLTMLVMR